MNSHKNKVQNLINRARKERDYTYLSVCQSILSNIQSKENDPSVNADLSDEQILNIIKKEEQIYQESADLFVDKSPSESANYKVKSQICADLFADLAPEQIDESEYEDFARNAIYEVGATSPRDMGKVMKYVKENYSGRIDMQKISAQVKDDLNNM